MRIAAVFIYGFLIILPSAFAQELALQEPPGIHRDAIILFTMDIMAREAAMRGVLDNTQLISSQGRNIEGKERTPFFKNINATTHPYLTLATTFNDNINNSPQNKSDLINNFTPGLKVNFEGYKKNLRLDTFIENNYSNNRPSSNIQGFTVDTLSNFGIGRYALAVSDAYFTNRISTPELGIKIDENPFYWKNSFNASLGRSFNRAGFSLGFDRVDYDYEPSRGLANDRFEETYSFNQHLRVAPKTVVLPEYSYGRTVYIQSPYPSKESKFHNFNLILTGVVSPKITYATIFGYKLTDQKVGDDVRETVFTEELSYNTSERRNFGLSFKHVIHEEATKSDYYTEYYFKISANNRFAFNPKFNLSFTYASDFVGYTKLADFTKKNEIHILTLGLSYAFRQWLDFSLDYARTLTHSNVEDDYHKTAITFKTGARF